MACMSRPSYGVRLPRATLTIRCKAVKARLRPGRPGRRVRWSGERRTKPVATRAESVRRAPLSRQRVLDAAVELADRGGIEALTMRKLAQELGVEAMSLYHHVASK